MVETLDGKTGSLTMMLSVSPPGGDFTEPVTQACLRAAGAFLMLDTSLAHRRHFPAINWNQSYSLYEGELGGHFSKIHPEWTKLKARCRELLQAEALLKEVTEIVGYEGLQDADRLTMKTAESIRTFFLMQNAYTEDAFSPPDKTASRMESILESHDMAIQRLAGGASIDDVLKTGIHPEAGEK